MTVTVKTSALTTQLFAPSSGRGSAFANWTFPLGFGVFVMFLLGGKKGRKHSGMFLLMMVLSMGTLFSVGCGSSTATESVQTGNVTPSGTYSIVVIGTSGSMQHFTPLTLTVQ